MRHLAPLAVSLLLGSASIAAAQPRVGQPAPAIRARAVDAEGEIGMDRYRGRVVLVVFVATWCGACRRLAPELERLSAAHPDLAVVALSHESRSRIRRHVARAEPGVPWLQCTGHTAVQWGADALPTYAVVGRDGVVRASFQGVEGSTVAALSRAVADALETR
ncbi:MAG: TlpA family protein disulfide reductase [Sandaracinaceae bacterium]